MAIVITPQVFFDLFILCLSWQWEPSSLTHCYTTVDKVVRILHGLKLLTDSQRKSLYKNRRTQQLFVMRGKGLYLNAFAPEKRPGTKDADGWGARREELLGQSCHFFFGTGTDLSVNRERLLRDTKLYLTYRGKFYAESIAAKYAQALTRKQYFAEIDRQDTLSHLSEAGRVAVVTEYRRRVLRETAEE